MQQHNAIQIEDNTMQYAYKTRQDKTRQNKTMEFNTNTTTNSNVL